MCAIWQPVTIPAETPAGSPSSSRSHSTTTSSTTPALGVGPIRPAFWSHAEVSQSAAIAAGSAPPMTKPKKRPDGIAMIPGSAASISSAMTCAASVSPLRQRPAERGAKLLDRRVGRTRRSSSPSRNWLE